MNFPKLITAAVLVGFGAVKAQKYALNFTYDASNWYEDGVWNFRDEKDPTHGAVRYQDLKNAQSLSLTKIIDGKVFMGVDNSTVIPYDGGANGRKSIWLTSQKKYDHYLLIADFEHMPGGECGTWPGFWSINDADGFGEIDIMEGANNQSHNDVTIHTKNSCTFDPRNESGLNHNSECGLQDGNLGCNTQGGEFGAGFNAMGGGVYATVWNSAAINVYWFPRGDIPQDITAGNPDPSSWGLPPLASFAGANGGCDIDSNIWTQTIYFDTTFCGANAGGEAWTNWSTCSEVTGVATCEQYVQEHPEAFDNAYWLINSVKVYSEVDSDSPAPPAASPAISTAQSSKSSTVASSSTQTTGHAHAGVMAVSVDGSCGPDITCQGSTFGNCCSAAGWCGSSPSYCDEGCQPSYGTCSGSTVTDTDSALLVTDTESTLSISDYGTCGGATRTTCKESVFGNCCSMWGFCGSTDEYCGLGCQGDFGTCS